MKKIITTAILFLFAFNFYFLPAYAIVENETTLDKINYAWWQGFGDEYLSDYILRASKNNHDIKTAALKIEQAKINVTATRADQLPSLTVAAAPALAKMPGKTQSEGTFALPIFAQYELDLFGKNWDKTKSAKKLLKSTQYQEIASDISIVSLVGSVYYNIVKLDKLIELQTQLRDDRKIIYDLMKASNEEGIASVSDLVLAEKNYVLSQNDLINLEKSRQQALSSLAVLVGDSPENINDYKRISYDDLMDNFDVPETISSEIIVNRPDYKAIEAQLEAAGIDIRVAKKEFLPKIDILGLLTFIAMSSSGMNWTNSLALLAGSATLPVFTGFRRVANLKFNKNKYEQLGEQYQKTNLNAIQDVNDALYFSKSDKERYINNVHAQNLQNQDFGFANAKYNAGTISKLDLTQREEALIYTKQLTVSSKIDCYLDKIGLYKASGAQI
ncbi:TolC family protein [bacterium]|nr:TolC family protein [bacterium]